MSIRTGRLARSAAFWALAGLALLVSHDAVFLAQTGPGEGLAEVLRTAGHDYWGAASAALVVVGLLTAGGVAVRLHRLRRRAAALGARPAASGGYARRALLSWARLFAIVALAFMLQESAEHFGAHGHAIGIGALAGPEYPLALPVIAAITGLAALLAAVLIGVERGLVTGIAAVLARAWSRHASRVARRTPASVGPASPSVLSRPGASRAPPPVLAT